MFHRNGNGVNESSGKWLSSSFSVPWESIARLCALCCCFARLGRKLFLSCKQKNYVDLKSKKAEEKREEKEQQEQASRLGAVIRFLPFNNMLNFRLTDSIFSICFFFNLFSHSI